MESYRLILCWKRMCLFAASKHLLDAGAFVCKLTSGGAQGLGRLRIICIGEKANSMSCVGMLQLPLTFTPRTESASGAGSEAIGPLSNPTGDRYRRLAELMTPDDLDIADPPDTAVVACVLTAMSSTPVRVLITTQPSIAVGTTC